MLTCLLFVAFCSNLPEIVDGNLDYNMDDAPFIGTRPNGTVVTYTCDDGFKFDGNATNRTCFNGDWTGTEPMCIKGKSCIGIVQNIRCQHYNIG